MAENTIQNGQTCLEIRGMEQRTKERVRRHYNENDQYGFGHKDTISDGDPQGKSSGHGGHTSYLPNCQADKNLFDYSNFDTSPESNIGGSFDINGREGHPGRKQAMARSLYNHLAPYGAALVSTEANRADGQIYLNY